MVDPILATKLFVPSTRPGSIRRPRLNKRLKAGRFLTLISAPAGYGKTTLLAEWIEAYPGRVAWLALDEQDNHALRFWAHFVSALQTLSKSQGQAAMQMLEAAQNFDIQMFLTALVNDVAAVDHQIILVLDDYHLISNPEIHAGLTFLLEHLPPSLHLVISTRADPPLPISRFRARGQLNELRIDDLRFSYEETSEFLNDSMNMNLNSTDVQALETRTEGWIAGLQLAMLSMQSCIDRHAFIQAFTGSQHYILEYLVDEVLKRESEASQRFLLETSILRRMCAPLCNAVTESGDGANVIADLYRRNLFVIPLDGEHYWFRYHQLFAELLKGHLQRTRAGDLPALHRRAAQWFQSNQFPEDALQHAFAIPDDAYVSRLVVDNWRNVYHHGRLDTAVQWLESLSADLIRQSPPLGVAYCWTLFARGDYDRIAAYLDDIMQVFKQLVSSDEFPEKHPEYNIIAQQVILLRSIVLRHRGDVSTSIREIEQLLPTVEQLRPTLGPLIVDMGFTACFSQLGYSYLAANDLNRAAEYLSRVSPHARNCGNLFALAHVTMEWVRICLLQGRIEQAEEICRHELALTERPGYADYPAFCLIRLALANVLRVKKSWNEAEILLNQGLETARKSGHEYYLAQGYLIAALIHHAQGKTAPAQEDIRCAEQIAASIHNRFLIDAIAQTRLEMENKTSPVQQSLIEPLSERELEVLRLICAGKSNQEIADELIIALNTVKAHINNIFGKLGIRRRAQAILEARRLGLV